MGVQNSGSIWLRLRTKGPVDTVLGWLFFGAPLLGRPDSAWGWIIDRYALFLGQTSLVLVICWAVVACLSKKLQIGGLRRGTTALMRELFYWVFGSMCAVVPIVLLMNAYGTSSGLIKIFDQKYKYGTAYYWLGFAIVLVLWDFYFYVTHVALHHRWLFRFHSTHHRSVATATTTAFSFHPVESVVQYGFNTFLILLIPVHFHHLLAVSWFALIFDTMQHSGYQFWPSRFLRTSAVRIFNNPIHHSMHHQHGRGNYSIVFNFWDRVFKTNHPEYFASIEEFASRAGE
jgi:lathosterol oxidase